FVTYPAKFPVCFFLIFLKDFDFVTQSVVFFLKDLKIFCLFFSFHFSTYFLFSCLCDKLWSRKLYLFLCSYKFTHKHTQGFYLVPFLLDVWRNRKKWCRFFVIDVEVVLFYEFPSCFNPFTDGFPAFRQYIFIFSSIFLGTLNVDVCIFVFSCISMIY